MRFWKGRYLRSLVAASVGPALALGQAPTLVEPPLVTTTTKPAPVVVRRKPAAVPARVAEAGRLPNEAVPSSEQYPFGHLIETLEGQPAPSDQPRPLSMGNSITSRVRLPEAAREALVLSQQWMSSKAAVPPAEGKDGRVIYTYGSGLPTVVCAPLRICVVELQPGERITGEPHIGDAVRWSISPATAGQTEASTSFIVIKPKQPGLDTTLLVTTDRRAYYVRLVSAAEEYLARVAFAYSDEDEHKWQVQAAKQAEERRKQELEASRITPVESLDNLYIDYAVVGGDEHMRPVKVVDDGRRTYIQMPASATVREVPVLVIVGPDGAEMVNYRVKGDLYIVDRLFERGALICGVGKRARKAEIIRGTYRDPKSGKRRVASKPDPYVNIMAEAERSQAKVGDSR